MGLSLAATEGVVFFPAEPGQPWPSARPRHRRPTLLARGGQAVAGRLATRAGLPPSPAHLPPAPPRRPARIYWT